MDLLNKKWTLVVVSADGSASFADLDGNLNREPVWLDYQLCLQIWIQSRRVFRDSLCAGMVPEHRFLDHMKIDQS